MEGKEQLVWKKALVLKVGKILIAGEWEISRKK